jgi:hypothetical protein
LKFAHATIIFIALLVNPTHRALHGIADRDQDNRPVPLLLVQFPTSGDDFFKLVSFQFVKAHFKVAPVGGVATKSGHPPFVRLPHFIDLKDSLFKTGEKREAIKVPPVFWTWLCCEGKTNR